MTLSPREITAIRALRTPDPASIATTYGVSVWVVLDVLRAGHEPLLAGSESCA